MKPISFPGWREETIAALKAALEPTSRQSMAQWALKHYRLPASSAEPGPYDVTRTPYLIEPLECLAPHKLLPRITIRKASQVGGTEIGLVWIAHNAHTGGGNMTAAWATAGAARRNSVTRIDPQLKHLGINIIGDTQMLKVLPGMSLKLCGAKSANEFVGDIARKVLADETARWPRDLEKEGNPIELVQRAMITFGDSAKFLELSTPTIEGECNISDSYEMSDQSHYLIPCPNCQSPFEWEWQYLKWNDNDEWIECPVCGHHIQEARKPQLLAKGEWVALFPERSSTHRGFQIGGLLSPLGWRSWRRCIQMFEKGQDDPSLEKVWKNQVCAEPWSAPPDVAVEAAVLSSRPKTGVEGIAPEEVCVITAGVDVQPKENNPYLAVEVVGWGPSMQSWSIRWDKIEGQIRTPEGDGWEKLAQLLATPIATTDGKSLPIRLACIDCGGTMMQTVMRFCTQNPDQRVAIKGYGGWQRHNATWRYVDHQRGGMGVGGPRYAALPVDQIKQTVYDWWAATEGYGYCHFPARPNTYFNQLTAEEVVLEFDRYGKQKRRWRLKKGRIRNEALDCRVYALGAARILSLEALTKEEWAAARTGELGLVASAMEQQARTR